MFEDIIHQFDLPNSIITDLGSTFTGNDFWDLCVFSPWWDFGVTFWLYS
jgi:hypothetical protein